MFRRIPPSLTRCIRALIPAILLSLAAPAQDQPASLPGWKQFSMTYDSLMETATLSNLLFGRGEHPLVIDRYSLSVFSSAKPAPGSENNNPGGRDPLAFPSDSFPRALLRMIDTQTPAVVCFEYITAHSKSNPGRRSQLPPVRVEIKGR
jgi:hypothetical protein